MNKKHVLAAGLLSTIIHIAFMHSLLPLKSPYQEKTLDKPFIDARLIVFEREHSNPEKQALQSVVEATPKKPDSSKIKGLLAHEPDLLVDIGHELNTETTNESLIAAEAFQELIPKRRGGSPFTRHLRSRSQPMPPLMRPLTTDPQTLVCAEEIDDVCEPAESLGGTDRE
jgi:hypothetical protein